MTTVSADPLILTLDLDAVSQKYFDDLRVKYFPPARNQLRAHLTLFHHLPAGAPEITGEVEQLSRELSTLSLTVSGLMSLGGGVAFRIGNDKLSAFHKKLQQSWLPHLTAQDKQKRSFHITIQNKVPAPTAATLLQELQTGFTPFEAQGTGLTLWTYKNGPWEWRQHFPFEAGENAILTPVIP